MEYFVHINVVIVRKCKNLERLFRLFNTFVVQSVNLGRKTVGEKCMKHKKEL